MSGVPAPGQADTTPVSLRKQALPEGSDLREVRDKFMNTGESDKTSPRVSRAGVEQLLSGN